MKNSDLHTETRHVVIYGYKKQELTKLLSHFTDQLPDYIKIAITSDNLITKVTLTGISSGVELLRFNINRFHRNIKEIFSEDVVAMEDASLAEVLGQMLRERELSVSFAESCTGGNLAHRITEIPGSSAYFLGSVVSYGNNVKADVLGVSRSVIAREGAVSEEVVREMADGVSKLMRTNCAIATSGIAGPEGGTKYKPVGTVWMAAKYNSAIVTECIHFDGDRNTVIQSATNHSMMMLINLLRSGHSTHEDYNDE